MVGRWKWAGGAYSFTPLLLRFLAAGVPAALGAKMGREAVRTAVSLAADVDLRRIHRA